MNSPQPCENGVLCQHYDVVHYHPVTRPSLLYIKPAEDVDNANHHVEEHLLPLGHAEVCASMNHPESHGAPVEHHEDPEVNVEKRGEESQWEDPGWDG